MKKMIDENMIV